MAARSQTAEEPFQVPSWLEATTDGGGGGGRRKREAEEVVQEAAKKAARKGGDVLEELVLVLASLVLVNSRELANLCGTVYTTCLLPVQAAIGKAAVAAGKKYDEQVKQLKEDKETDDSVDTGKLGSPYLHVWAAVIMMLVQEEVDAERKAFFKKYWDEVIMVMPLQQLGEHIRYFRVRAPKGKEKEKEAKKKKQTVKLQFAFNVEGIPAAQGLSKFFEGSMLHEGGERKVGPAPRGSLERDAQRLLDKVKRGR